MVDINVDYIGFNEDTNSLFDAGSGSGSVGALLLRNNMNTNVLKPFYDFNTRKEYISQPYRNDKGEVCSRRVPVTNANAVLTKDEWIELDRTVIQVARPELKLVMDLRSSPGLEKRVTNGWGTTVLQHQTMSDVGQAMISMSPSRRSLSDRPAFELGSLPLPIIHGDVEFDIRELAVSRSSGNGWDLSNLEQVTRRVAEKAEQLALGTETYAYAGGTVYGLLNFPQRITYSMTLPTAAGWTPKTLIGEILAMMAASRAVNYKGPWTLYNSPNWDQYLDDDYSAAYNGDTLRARIGKIRGITSVETLDYMTGWRMVLVQKTSNVVQMVVGMEMQTLQWQVGTDIKLKVMTILVPRVRADYNGNTGLVVGTAS